MKDTKSAEEFLEEYYLLTLNIIEEEQPVQYSLIVKAMTDFAASEKAESLEACKEFVRKVECGEARSKRSYAQMKQAIKNAK